MVRWNTKQEAVRSGHLEHVQLLVEHGADVNARTKGEEAGASGGTPLWWAHNYLDPESDVIEFLKANGGKLIAPQAKSEEDEDEEEEEENDEEEDEDEEN